jgi:hypothetical protein
VKRRPGTDVLVQLDNETLVDGGNAFITAELCPALGIVTPHACPYKGIRPSGSQERTRVHVPFGVSVPGHDAALFEAPDAQERDATRLVTSFSIRRSDLFGDAANPRAKLVISTPNDLVYEIKLSTLVSDASKDHRGTQEGSGRSKQAVARGVQFDDFVFTIDVVSATERRDP